MSALLALLICLLATYDVTKGKALNTSYVVERFPFCPTACGTITDI